MAIKKKSQLRCLILYPGHLESYYTTIYSRAILEANGEPISLNRIFTVSPRIKKVQQVIDQAEFVIADFTGKDKDVVFRAGYAQALGKPVGILAQSEEDIPSDLQHFGYVLYDTQKPDWAANLKKDMINLMNEVLEENR